MEITVPETEEADLDLRRFVAPGDTIIWTQGAAEPLALTRELACQAWADVDFIVTEHGVAALRGRTLAERARALIAIADPRFEEELARGAEQHRAAARAAEQHRRATPEANSTRQAISIPPPSEKDEYPDDRDAGRCAEQ